MQDWFDMLSSTSELSASAIKELSDIGFAIIPGPVATEHLTTLVAAYDAAIATAKEEDVKNGSTSTRIRDFVNRGAKFDDLYIYRPVLEACCRVIGRPFRLSTMHARTVRARSQAQVLHVDYARDAIGWTMIGFIFMVDEFSGDNGATRFLPASHHWSNVPDKIIKDSQEDYENQILACGPPGSMIIYNGAVWHGHAANSSDRPRRSIQGAYIRRDAWSGENLSERMCNETLARISPLARYVLAV
jgi:ectoine hydroxylase-related dioxygenase (phytanoyl-CoA dioxygenase family)